MKASVELLREYQEWLKGDESIAHPGTEELQAALDKVLTELEK